MRRKKEKENYIFRCPDCVPIANKCNFESNAIALGLLEDPCSPVYTKDKKEEKYKIIILLTVY